MFFRTRQCTRVHRLGVQKCAKLEKRVCFWPYRQVWKGHDGQIKKNTCKNTYLGSIFIHEKYVFRVCFESPFTRMISSLKYKWPPRALSIMIMPKIQPYSQKWLFHEIKINVHCYNVINFGVRDMITLWKSTMIPMVQWFFSITLLTYYKGVYGIDRIIMSDSTGKNEKVHFSHVTAMKCIGMKCFV